jgi:hypothetical protein
MSWVDNWIQVNVSTGKPNCYTFQSHRLSMALSTRVSPLPGHTDSSNSVPDLRFDEELSGLSNHLLDGIDRFTQLTMRLG